MTNEETSRTKTARQPSRRVQRIARVVVLDSADERIRGQPFLLTDEAPLQLGREGYVDRGLALRDPEVSRHHARFETNPSTGAWCVVDEESRNGTFVNGVQVTRRDLVSNDVVRVGRTLLLMQWITLGGDDRLEPEAPPLFGASIAMQRVRAQVSQFAPTDLPVLITGETGVGKELVARAMHDQSGRTGRFVPVNCAAIPAHVAESELFGHASGSFTGATRDHQGLFGAADRGTLFLDEIGELPTELQPKLLRALAEGEVRQVGSTTIDRVDVRIVAATLRSLERAEDFRADLYARLAAHTIHVSPLRERREDILPLAMRFLHAERRHVTFDRTAAEALLTYDWPYNVRELKFAAAHVKSVIGDSDEIMLEMLPAPVRAQLEERIPVMTPNEVPLALRVRREGTPSREELQLALQHFAGSVGQVASFFAKDRRQIYRWIEHHKLDVDTYRD